MINKVTTATLMYAYSMKKEVIDEDCVYQGYKECEL